MRIIFCNVLSSLSYHLNFTLIFLSRLLLPHSSSLLFYHLNFTFISAPSSSRLTQSSYHIHLFYHLNFILFSTLIILSDLIITPYSSSFLSIIISISPSSLRHLLVSPNHHAAFIFFLSYFNSTLTSNLLSSHLTSLLSSQFHPHLIIIILSHLIILPHSSSSLTIISISPFSQP